jgi:uncharacterized membrane protein
MPIAHIVATSLPAFLASLVEFVEALTIVLAVGVTRGWRSAGAGTIAGVAALAIAVIALGPFLGTIPIVALQLVVGIMLLFFGMRWLRKAILRYAGVIALHDEAKIFDRERANLDASSQSRVSIDAVGALTAFNAVVLEGLEVVFIVIAVGATAGTLGYASAGAALAGVVVIGAGLLARAPLSRVPENALKFTVGIMLTGFGVFWTGEGLHYAWPGDELSLLAIVGFFALVSLLGIVIARPRTA